MPLPRRPARLRRGRAAGGGGRPLVDLSRGRSILMYLAVELSKAPALQRIAVPLKPQG